MSADLVDRRMNSINNWIALAKNALWIVGVVAIATIKLNSIDNTNATQDDKIARVAEETRVLKATINSINDKQVDQLVMLTKLVVIAEQNNKNNNFPTKDSK